MSFLHCIISTFVGCISEVNRRRSLPPALTAPRTVYLHNVFYVANRAGDSTRSGTIFLQWELRATVEINNDGASTPAIAGLVNSSKCILYCLVFYTIHLCLRRQKTLSFSTNDCCSLRRLPSVCSCYHQRDVARKNFFLCCHATIPRLRPKITRQ